MGVKTSRSLALFVFVVLAATLSAFSLSIAFADDGFVTDEDDSSGPLDIERFGFFQDDVGGHLVLDLYENLDVTLLDEQLDWIGFILEDDIVNDGYVQAVFVTYSGKDLEAGLYSSGQGGPESQRFIKPVGVQMIDANSIEVVLDEHDYAWFHRWFAQTSFETEGPDDRGYPACNWPTPPPRPYPLMAKCRDESDPIVPTFEQSPFPTDTGGPPTPPTCEGQSQCKKTYITIHRGDHFFRGVVKHPRGICENQRRVVLKRTDGEKIGSDETDFEGRWRVRMENANGDFYAFAREVTYARDHADDVFCRRVQSITAHL